MKKSSSVAVQSASRPRWWLIVGALSFTAVFLYSLSDILQGPPADIPLATIDWLAASVVYFFLGALIGHLVDWQLAKRNREKLEHPCWFWATLGLWLVGIIVGFYYGEITSPGKILLYLFFPVIYGVFFTSFAFEVIAKPWVYAVAARVVFDLAFLAAFFGWLLLTIKLYREGSLKQKSVRAVRRALLLAVMLVLLIGMVSCARKLT